MPMGALNRLVQAAFRVRNDDGVESLSEANGGATQIGADNTNWDQAADSPFRLRILTTHAHTGTVFNSYITLRASYNGGAFTQVSDVSSYVRTKITSYWTNLDNSTEFAGRLGSGTWFNNPTAWGGLIDDANIGADTYSSYFQVPDTEAREIETEWCLELVDADVSIGDTIDFRMYDIFGNIYSDGYTFTPRATVVSGYTAPSITNTPAADHEAESDYAETMTASDGTAPLVWSLDVAPDTATIDSSTGSIAWTPLENEVGDVVNFTARVTDAVDGTDTLAWTVTVTDVQLTARVDVVPALTARIETDPTQTLASDIVPALDGKVDIS